MCLSFIIKVNLLWAEQGLLEVNPWIPKKRCTFEPLGRPTMIWDHLLEAEGFASTLWTRKN